MNNITVGFRNKVAKVHSKTWKAAENKRHKSWLVGWTREARVRRMLLFPTVLRSARLTLRLSIMGLCWLCSLVWVEILCSAEEQNMGFRSYEWWHQKKDMRGMERGERTVDLVMLPAQALSDADPPPFCL